MNPKTGLLHTTPWPGTACLCLLPSSSCATPLAFGIDSLVRDPNHSFARAHGPILSRLPAERPKQCAHRNRFHLPLTDRLQATTGRLVVAQIILLRGHGKIKRCHHRRNASIAPRFNHHGLLGNIYIISISISLNLGLIVSPPAPAPYRARPPPQTSPATLTMQPSGGISRLASSHQS